MKLEKYQAKRNFKKTSEPLGKIRKTNHNRFCVQYHSASRLHYDFRLEFDEVLLSWAVPKGPSFNSKDKRLAVHVEDHPLDYLTFEGTIPKGEYGGGTVMLWDIGTYTPINDFKKGLKEGNLKFTLFGERLLGNWALVRLKEENNWLLIKEKDKHSKLTNGISKYKNSVSTNRSFKEIEIASSLAKTNYELKPAKLVDDIPKGKDWIYEVKYDGYRISAVKENKNVTLFTRNHKDYTKYFPCIIERLKMIPNDFIMDGEIVVIDENGRTDFQLLQNYLKDKNTSASYIVFDLLNLDNLDLRSIPLIERKKLLKNLIKKDPLIIYSKHISQIDLSTLEETVKRYALEGIIIKNKNSIYSSNRDLDWQKRKYRNEQEFIIGGYSLSSKKEGYIKSLLLGVYVDNKLIYIGNVGSGFSLITSKYLTKIFKKYTRKTNPFYSSPSFKEDITYLSPKLLAQVEYSEFTKEGMLRQPSFKGLRNDKESKQVEIEEYEE